MMMVCFLSLGETFASGNNSNSDQILNSSNANNKGAAQFIPDITKEMENVYGSIENFEKNGGIYFDSNGVVHLGFKEPNSEMNSKAVQALSKSVKNKDFVSTERVKYSTADLNEIKDKILTVIQHFFTEEEFIHLNFSISASFSDQKIILEHNNLPEKLIAQLKDDFNDILQVENADISVEPSKGREENWNQQGAGLGITNKYGVGCSTAGIASKNGNYFILTAGHCFEGTTSTTSSADIIKQYIFNVGRQHAIGTGSSLDVGLVRITNDNTLTGGRYATNKIKRWSSTDVFDGSFVDWTTIYDGTQICKTGKTTNTTCGTVVNANTTVKYSGYPTFNVAKVNGTDFSKPGDSGGAAFYPYIGDQLLLAGIVSGNTTTNGVITGGFITKYRDVKEHYNIDLYTSDTNFKVVN